MQKYSGYAKEPIPSLTKSPEVVVFGEDDGVPRPTADVGGGRLA